MQPPQFHLHNIPACTLKIRIILIYTPINTIIRKRGLCTRQGHILSRLQLTLILTHSSGIKMHLWRSQSRTRNKLQPWISRQLSRQPQERFLEIVVTFRGNVKVLKILFTVESDCFSLDFTVFDVDFVSAKNDGDTLADTREIA